MRRLTLALGGLLAAAATTWGATAAAAQETASVYVVHGIPDTPVDVYVDGARVLDDFQPGADAGPVDVPAGSREVAVFPADAADGSGSPLLSASPEVPAGGNVTLVAHLTEGGQPTVTPFVNDVSAVPAGQARVVVRHTAAAPAVDVLAGGSPVISGLANPGEGVLVVPAGTIPAAVAAAGTTEPVIGPADLDLQEGTATFVHAIGSLDAGNPDLVVFTVEGLHTAPNGVPSGAPSGAPATGEPPIDMALVAAGAALAGASAYRLRAAHRERGAQAGYRG
jgi:Domain of unknown function (DUF4397)